jgi:spore coat protein CotH
MTGRHVLRWSVLVASVGIVLGQNGAAQGPGFGFGGGELELVERFDSNGDGWLNADERREARRVAASQAGGGRGFGRFMGGVGGGTPEPGPSLTPKDVRTYGNEHLYDLGVLRTIFLTFEAPDWEQELEVFKNTDVDVPALMAVDGRTYRDVGVSFRGASSFMMVPAGYKRSLNLSINFVHGEQRLGGYRTLNLLNAANDPTFLRAVLYTEIARQYIPVPRMNFVRVVINGESWGIYLNAQQFNSDLIRDYFNVTSGARWKVPGSPRGMGGLEYLGPSADAYRSIYEIKNRDREQSWTDLANLARVLNETPPAELEAALRPILDVDGVLKFLALEVAMVNSDGYWSRASDYNLYQDPAVQVAARDHGAGDAGDIGRQRRGQRMADPRRTCTAPK